MAARGQECFEPSTDWNPSRLPDRLLDQSCHGDRGLGRAVADVARAGNRPQWSTSNQAHVGDSGHLGDSLDPGATVVFPGCLLLLRPGQIATARRRSHEYWRLAGQRLVSRRFRSHVDGVAHSVRPAVPPDRALDRPVHQSALLFRHHRISPGFPGWRCHDGLGSPGNRPAPWCRSAAS